MWILQALPAQGHNSIARAPLKAQAVIQSCTLPILDAIDIKLLEYAIGFKAIPVF